MLLLFCRDSFSNSTKHDLAFYPLTRISPPSTSSFLFYFSFSFSPSLLLSFSPVVTPIFIYIQIQRHMSKQQGASHVEFFRDVFLRCNAPSVLFNACFTLRQATSLTQKIAHKKNHASLLSEINLKTSKTRRVTHRIHVFDQVGLSSKLHYLHCYFSCPARKSERVIFVTREGFSRTTHFNLQ